MLKSETLTQCLTPIQEKAVLGVDFAKVADAEMVESSDSTFASLQGIDSLDVATFNSWFTAVVQDQYNYATTVIAMDKLLELGEITGEQAIERLILIETNNLPAFSNLSAWQYLKAVMKKLSTGVFKGVSTFGEFQSKFSKLNSSNVMNKVFLYLCGYFHFQSINSPLEIKELVKSLTEFCYTYSKGLEFPKAETSNNELINPLLNLLIYLWRKPNVRFEIGKYIVKYVQSTYHNSRVAKILCLNSIKLNHPKECLAAFKTYINYIDDYKVKHKGVYDDLIATISLYAVVLEYLSRHMKTYDDYKEIHGFSIKLKDLILEFLIYFVGDDSRYYISELQNYLNFIYSTVATIYENCIPFSDKSIEESVDEMVRITTKAIKSISKNQNVNKKRLAYNFYKNSYYLHKSGDDEGAIKRIKRALVNDPDNVSYLSFLVKLYSGDEETYSMAVELAADVLENALLLPERRNSLKVKNDIIELYLIYLTLLKFEAVDHLGGLFGVLNELFDNQFKQLKTKQHLVRPKQQQQQRQTNTIGDYNEDGCSPCEPTKTRRLFGSNSIRKSTSSKRPASTPTATTTSTSNLIVTLEMRSIQKIWLNISRLLQGLDSLEGALDAVDAAEAIYANGECNARRGCVLLAMGESMEGTKWVERALEKTTGGISSAEAVVALYYFGGSSAAESRAQSLAAVLVGQSEFVRDIHLLVVVGALSKSTRAWNGVKIL